MDTTTMDLQCLIHHLFHGLLHIIYGIMEHNIFEHYGTEKYIYTIVSFIVTIVQQTNAEWTLGSISNTQFKAYANLW